jgi:hypothetical protein
MFGRLWAPCWHEAGRRGGTWLSEQPVGPPRATRRPPSPRSCRAAGLVDRGLVVPEGPGRRQRHRVLEHHPHGPAGASQGGLAGMHRPRTCWNCVHPSGTTMHGFRFPHPPYASVPPLGRRGHRGLQHRSRRLPLLCHQRRRVVRRRADRGRRHQRHLARWLEPGRGGGPHRGGHRVQPAVRFAHHQSRRRADDPSHPGACPVGRGERACEVGGEQAAVTVKCAHDARRDRGTPPMPCTTCGQTQAPTLSVRSAAFLENAGGCVGGKASGTLDVTLSSAAVRSASAKLLRTVTSL